MPHCFEYCICFMTVFVYVVAFIIVTKFIYNFHKNSLIVAMTLSNSATFLPAVGVALTSCIMSFLQRSWYLNSAAIWSANMISYQVFLYLNFFCSVFQILLVCPLSKVRGIFKHFSSLCFYIRVRICHK